MKNPIINFDEGRLLVKHISNLLKALKKGKISHDRAITMLDLMQVTLQILKLMIQGDKLKKEIGDAMPVWLVQALNLEEGITVFEVQLEEFKKCKFNITKLSLAELKAIDDLILIDFEEEHDYLPDIKTYNGKEFYIYPLNFRKKIQRLILEMRGKSLGNI